MNFRCKIRGKWKFKTNSCDVVPKEIYYSPIYTGTRKALKKGFVCSKTVTQLYTLHIFNICSSSRHSSGWYWLVEGFLTDIVVYEESFGAQQRITDLTNKIVITYIIIHTSPSCGNSIFSFFEIIIIWRKNTIPSKLNHPFADSHFHPQLAHFSTKGIKPNCGNQYAVHVTVHVLLLPSLSICLLLDLPGPFRFVLLTQPSFNFPPTPPRPDTSALFF